MKRSKCSFKGCRRVTRCKELCTSHYNYRWSRLPQNIERIKKKQILWEKNNKEKARESRRRNRYRPAVSMAKFRGFKFTLAKKEYLDLISKPCHYCSGFFPKTQVGIGLDRINNDLGYIKDNVLSCCYTCNSTRNRFFTVEETKVMISKVIEMRLNVKS